MYQNVLFYSTDDAKYCMSAGCFKAVKLLHFFLRVAHPYSVSGVELLINWLSNFINYACRLLMAVTLRDSKIRDAQNNSSEKIRVLI